MSLESTGRLIVKYDTQQVSEKFKKREFVIELAEEINGKIYTNYAKFQLTQAKCDIIDRCNVGDNLKVSFNIKGNKWERDGKTNYITNLEAWRIEVVSSGSNTQQRAQSSTSSPASGNTGSWDSPPAQPATIDDLPF